MKMQRYYDIREGLYNLPFCPEYGCKDNFETEFELECHVLSGKHSGDKKS